MKQDEPTQGLEVYVVGGAVRDTLLGLPAGDRDWVVVGATPEEMSARGFIPVGGDFPVFLHPISKEEYALARTERKSARGYQGFTFYTGAEVTLAQDLRRRDLTINAIARKPDGELVDPLGGVPDLQARIFRHAGAAFAEDAVRILRLGRFAARFGDFTVAPETMALCQRMVQEGEADALVPERVWKELSRGLMYARPSRMLEVLEISGALARITPELKVSPKLGLELDQAAAVGVSLPGRYALMCRHASACETLSQRLRVPRECAAYGRLLPDVMRGLQVNDAAGWLTLIERCDALRKPERFADLLISAAVIQPVDHAAWQQRVQAVRTVDAQAIAQQCAGDPTRIKHALRARRLERLRCHSQAG